MTTLTAHLAAIFHSQTKNFLGQKQNQLKFNRNLILLTKYTVGKPTVKIR